MASIHFTPGEYRAGQPGHSVRRRLPRVRVILSRGRLDAEIAGGAHPKSDPALALRARQLIRPRYRARLAASLEHLVDDAAGDPGTYVSSAVPFQLDQVTEARGTLLSLAGALRDVDRVQPRGVALTLRLITDPVSPLYSGTGRALRRQAQAALDHLLAGSHPWCELPAAPPMPSDGSIDDHT